MEENKGIQRRDFLKFLAVGSVAAGGLRLARRISASETGGSSPYKWAMVIDQDKCSGCGQCTLACRAHNDVSPEISWNRVLDAGQVGDKKLFLPRPCMHCEELSVCERLHGWSECTQSRWNRDDGL